MRTRMLCLSGGRGVGRMPRKEPVRLRSYNKQSWGVEDGGGAQEAAGSSPGQLRLTRVVSCLLRNP